MTMQHRERQTGAPDSSDSREKLIQLLEFAREHTRGQMELEECPHGGWFATEDVKCWACDASSECAWLLHNDGVNPWHARSSTDLMLALKHAVGSIDLHIRKLEHNVQNCRCEVCDWMRSARQFAKQGN